MLQTVFLGFFLFLLSADHASVHLGEGNLKYAYFLVPFLWTWHPKTMLQIAVSLIKKAPPILAIGIVPLIFSVVFSFNRSQSLVWCGWLTFNLFTLISVFSFLKVNQFTSSRIRDSALIALSLIAGFGILQYISISFFNELIFSPQKHHELYRINGVSGWPHFMNIFSFLLLPIALSSPDWRKGERLVLAVLTFVLFQSMAKTGWILWVALGLLLLIFQRRIFIKKYIQYLAPITLLCAVLPSPGLTSKPTGGLQKMSHFAGDLNISANQNSSGRDRLMINLMGLKVFKVHPFFGIGPRSYGNYVATSFDRELPGENKWDVNHVINTRNENIWVELLVENGLIFTLLVLVLLGFYLWPSPLVHNNPIYWGAWSSLVLYYSLSGQFSQNILLTLVFSIWGIFIYAQELETTR